MDNSNGDEFSWVELSALAIDITDGSEDSAYKIGTWGGGTEYPNTIMAKSGLVGIGVTDPKNKLNIFSGTDTMMGFWGSSTYSAMQSVNLANTVLKDMRFDFDEAFFLGNAVGIGTTTPIGKLDILGVAGSVGSLGQLNRAGINLRIPNVIGQYTQITFSNDGGGAFGYGAIGMVMTNGSGIGLADMIFSTKGLGTDVVSTERLRIASNGESTFYGSVGLNSGATFNLKLQQNAHSTVLSNSAYANAAAVQAYATNTTDVYPGYGFHKASTLGAFLYATSRTELRLRGDGGTDKVLLMADQGYEEGTWTPNITMSGSSITPTYSYQQGTYTKIGRQIVAMFDITATVSGSLAGHARVTNLPFTVGSVTPGGSMAGYSVAQWRSSNLFNPGAANQQIKGFAEHGATFIYCQLDGSGTIGFGGGPGASWNNNGSSGRATGYIIYFVN